MRLTASIAWLAVALLGVPARAPVNHPFGAHDFTYAAGSIRPGHATDQAVRDFYDAWKARFLKQTCGTGRWVVLTDTQAGNLTVSEGHGYGMVLAALMAGHDPDAQTIFDGMYAYFRDHPTLTHSRLMAWNQNTSCNDVDGDDSATDGDLDIAFALLLADKQWGSCGAIDYLGEAKQAIADVKDGDVDGSTRYTLLGDWATPSDTQYYPSTRTSDFMLDHFRSYQAATGDAAWSGLRDRLYQIVDALQTGFSPGTGLLPDFVQDPLGSPHPASPGFLESPNDGAYYYNACRDPWRLATDYLVSGDARAKTAAQRIDTWIRTATGGDPQNIKSGYGLDGSSGPDNDYLSMAFVAPLGVGAMVDASNQAWLDALWDLVAATPITTDGYYENTLKLLAMIVMSGNWWAPEAMGAPSCDPGGTTLCTAGATVSDAQIVVGRAGGAPGTQTLRLDGKLFFPQGIPVSPLTVGAQLLVEDVGNGGAAIFDLTTATHPIPSASSGACDAVHDGWTASATRTLYRNRSTAIDPPTCTPGSAQGLYELQYRVRDARDVDFSARAKRATIGALSGPLRGTIVLGNDAAAGQSGACGVTATLACTPAGSKLRCR